MSGRLAANNIGRPWPKGETPNLGPTAHPPSPNHTCAGGNAPRSCTAFLADGFHRDNVEAVAGRLRLRDDRIKAMASGLTGSTALVKPSCFLRDLATNGQTRTIRKPADVVSVRADRIRVLARPRPEYRRSTSVG